MRSPHFQSASKGLPWLHLWWAVGLDLHELLESSNSLVFIAGVPIPLRDPGASGDICKAGSVLCGSLLGAKPHKEVVVKARSEGALGKGVRYYRGPVRSRPLRLV